MNRALLSLALAALLLPTTLAAGGAESADGGKGGFWRCLKGADEPHTIDLKDEMAKPERFKGPGTIKLIRLNRLRYATRLGTDVAYTPGPDLAIAGFIYDPTKLAKQAAGKAKEDTKVSTKALFEAPVDPVTRRMQLILIALDSAATAVEEIATTSKKAVDSQREAASLVNSLVLRSNETLSYPNGPTLLLNAMEEVKKSINAVLGEHLATPEDVAAARKQLTNVLHSLERLPFDERSFSEWAQSTTNADAYRGAITNANGLLAALKPYETGSEERKAFEAQRAKLREWRDILTELTPEGAEDIFSQVHQVACGYPFFENKTVTIDLKQVDRLETDPKKAESKRTLAIVECLSHVTVSGGVGVSAVEETDIQIVTVPTADGTAVERKIRFQDRGSRQVNPTTLIHTRLTAGESCDWHIAAGTVFDIDHPDSGIKLGYVLGASFSFKDFFYLTGGLQLGRVSKLADGVDITKPVPEDLSEVPLERHWTADWVLVGSFKIR